MARNKRMSSKSKKRRLKRKSKLRKVIDQWIQNYNENVVNFIYGLL